MFRRSYKQKKRKKLLILAVLVAILVAGSSFYYYKFASAAFLGNFGTLSWGQGTTTSSTNRGRISMSRYTFGSPGTFGTRFTQTQVANSAIQFVINKASPARNEKLVGFQLNNGSLYMDKCSGTCSATANLSANMWNQTILGSGVVTKAFDIAYEQETGRAMVVYAGNTTGKLYYCIYDGSDWGPVSNCAPTNGTNDISLTDGTTTLTGTPEWVTLSARGEQMPDIRTNDILLAVQDTNRDIFTIRWNGTSWLSTDRQVLSTTGGATVATTDSGNVDSAAFDIGWENTSGTEMAVYADGTNLSYRTSTGAGWSAASTISGLATAAQWIKVASDPQSNRLSMIVSFGSTTTVGSTATATPYIWKTNGTSAGWSSFTNLTMAQDAGQNISTVWEKSNTGVPKALYSASASANTQQPDWSSWTQSGGFVAWAALVTTSGDIIVGNEMAASPNSDIATMIQNDRDGRMRARTFSGAAWGALITTNLSTTMVDTTTGQTTNKTYTQKPYKYSYTPYAAWSQNWRVYDDESTAGPPGVALAPEGVTPQVTPNNIVRLRMSYAELGGNSMGDMRKKLQYSSGAGCPDSSSCTWTDVGAQGGGTIWRYGDGGFADNASLTITTLTGATDPGYAVENGTASASGDQHNAGDVQEYDYTVQNNGATLGTTYYFRGYDYGPSVSGGSSTNINAIYREQQFDINGNETTPCTTNGSASVCTYPSLQSFTSSPQAPIIYSPTTGSTNVALSPVIQLRSSDRESDYVQYVIEWCTANSWPCTATGGSFDQTSSQTNWGGQNANSNTAYQDSGVSEAYSTMGEYLVPPGRFQANTTYYLRAKAIDPAGSNAYSSYSTTISFTTASLDIRINGGACIGGVGAACSSTNGTQNIIIGN
jgi:hypothetical protein